ncbi:MAG: NlpC/P60 family protein [Bacteroidales bacterium]|nr:NlpC/P60 family protein [Bacteroidales bacterium]
MKKILLLTSMAAAVLAGCCNHQSDATIEKFNDIKKGVKAVHAPDGRSKTFDASLEKEGDKYVLRGVTTEQQAKDSLAQALKAANIKFEDSLFMLPCAKLGEKTYAVSTQSVINFRTGGKYSAESATQVMMGTPLRLLEKNDNGWTRAITPEGYIAWVTNASYQEMTKEELDAYKAKDKVIVTTKYTTIYEDNSDKSQMVSDAVWGNILIDLGNSGLFWRKVAIADGRTGYIPQKDVTNFDKWLESRNPTAENIIATAKQFIGVPYMWGGTSIKAVDCSGFTKSTYFLNGLVLARDASQQCHTGDNVDITKYVNDSTYTVEALANLKKGDLIFFGSKATPEKKERVTHVGIYIENGIFIHSAGKVRINSLIPTDSNYYSGSKRLLRACRIIGNQDMGKDIHSIEKLYK